jgi:hypothetical protein
MNVIRKTVTRGVTEDSTDDQPVPELSKRENALLQRALVEHIPDIPDCRDLSQVHWAVADGL